MWPSASKCDPAPTLSAFATPIIAHIKIALLHQNLGWAILFRRAHRLELPPSPRLDPLEIQSLFCISSPQAIEPPILTPPPPILSPPAPKGVQKVSIHYCSLSAVNLEIGRCIGQQNLWYTIGDNDKMIYKVTFVSFRHLQQRRIELLALLTSNLECLKKANTTPFRSPQIATVSRARASSADNPS